MNSSLLDICFVVSDVLLLSAGIGDGLSSSSRLARIVVLLGIDGSISS